MNTSAYNDSCHINSLPLRNVQYAWKTHACEETCSFLSFFPLRYTLVYILALVSNIRNHPPTLIPALSLSNVDLLCLRWISQAALYDGLRDMPRD
jgi:hypothetical protein